MGGGGRVGTWVAGCQGSARDWAAIPAATHPDPPAFRDGEERGAACLPRTRLWQLPHLLSDGRLHALTRRAVGGAGNARPHKAHHVLSQRARLVAQHVLHLLPGIVVGVQRGVEGEQATKGPAPLLGARSSDTAQPAPRGPAAAAAPPRRRGSRSGRPCTQTASAHLPQLFVERGGAAAEGNVLAGPVHATVLVEQELQRRAGARRTTWDHHAPTPTHALELPY